eukprot:CAMPEP_0177288196 /NCGR_PEP_ID=MMETSP0367-20130122/74543_1 /TAXON_ID=447022 ORGANISM="Scrippsiella hangoei-like, Strain SHHI-4" /NCGR_SAMPLE_ID=MMETSP0367 /ASSEMBLY_ACC=CAM_ASM_000362 /LENGTH=132 /DNA_ID=CAMNT_0018745525 /DNA_START=427 /DNA_END=825 /DNA_ORIENTATION=+
MCVVSMHISEARPLLKLIMPRVMVGCGCWLICMFMDLARGRSPSTAGDCPGAATAAARAMGLLAAAAAGAGGLSWLPIDPSNLDSTVDSQPGFRYGLACCWFQAVLNRLGDSVSLPNAKPTYKECLDSSTRG